MYELTPLNARAARWLELPLLASGSFSQVFDHGPCEVLKVTCCPATKELMALPSRPAGLPRLVRRLGAVAKDVDGLTYEGYILERLFSPDQWAKESVRARVLASNEANKRGARGPALCRSEEQDLARLMSLVGGLQPDPLDPVEAQFDFCLAMAGCTDGQLRDTFLALATQVRQHNWGMDLLTRGNVLLDAFGRIRFGDPVGEVPPARERDQSGPPPTLAWAVALLPLRQKGLKVDARWFAASSASAAEAEARTASCHSLGLQAQVLEDSTKAQTLLARPAVSLACFNLKGLADNLSKSAYAQALFGRA